jgi:Tol biopolymer transport system component
MANLALHGVVAERGARGWRTEGEERGGRRRRGIRRGAMLLLAGAALAVAGPLQGQYFGQNRVLYREFDFRVLATEHFDVYHYPEEEAAIRDAARMAERWYARLSGLLDHQLEGRQTLILYANEADFRQTGVISTPGEGTGGVTEGGRRRIIMPLADTYEQTDEVVGHELVHAFQYDISGIGRSASGPGARARGLTGAPLWFVEGMAAYLSRGPVDPLTAMWLRDAALSGTIPTIDQLTNDPRVFPYRWGQALWAYVGGRYGDAAIGQILKQVGQGIAYDQAMEVVLGAELEEIGEDWATSIRRAYLPLLTGRSEAREIARPLITERRGGGSLNVSPSLSPDGRFVAFLSEREEFEVELWLADARTGEVIRRLQKGTALDPEYVSLQFIGSAGTWSPDARQFAFTAETGGTDELVIVDVERARRTRELRIPDVRGLSNPTWSPDGSTIVVSGQRGGLSDLYAIDVRTGTARQLTDDRAAQLHPSYSPDGRTIAFVTDQAPGTDFTALRYGSYTVALLDVAGGGVRAVPGTAVASGPPVPGGYVPKSINPQWSPDGRSIYFISNRTGIPNVYRVELASGALSQVTRVFGGVAGITELSPALSVARGDGRLLFSAFERNNYNIYALTEPGELAGTPLPVAATAAARDTALLAATLPPVPRPPEPAFNRVLALLADPATGLPAPAAATAWAVRPYRPRISLEYLGQPQVGVSTGDAFGRGGLYGGISGIFSDQLRYHTIFGVVQAQGQLEELGFSTAYLNQRRRWNWGVAAQRIPAVYGFVAEGFDPRDPSLYTRQFVRTRFFDTSLQGLAQYPFSRAQRVEFRAGPRRISQDLQITEQSFQLDGSGRVIGGTEPEQREEEGPAFNLFESSAAVVYDNALVGYTSPIAGQRFRFELAPTFGSIQYTQAVADYRRYLFLRPFTLAVRGMHFGRYGADAEADAEGNRYFNDIYLGQPLLLRGYNDVYSRCVNQNGTGGECGVLQQLLGSRIGLVSAELRFPLIRQVVVGNFGLPPIEGIAFADAGTAWKQGTRPVLRRGLTEDPEERGILTSAGVGGRINLLGFAILEVDYVNGFESDRGWHWVFALQPGW